MTPTGRDGHAVALSHPAGHSAASWLLAGFIALAACLAFPAGRALAEEARLRLMAANLTSGPAQSYDPGHGLRILQGFRPDVTLIQEFNYGASTPEAIRGFVDSTFGAGFNYYRETGEIPNGVVSRWPIRQAGSWDDPPISNRDFAWARLDIPGTPDLWVVSVHLKAGHDTPARQLRGDQAQRLATHLKGKVPAGDYLAIGGDFNSQNRAEACIDALSALVDTTGSFPADSEGNGSTNFSRNKPYDWVLVNGALTRREVPIVIGNLRYPSGLVFDSRTFPRLDLVPPIQQEDSEAAGMQHMGVVRDFQLP